MDKNILWETWILYRWFPDGFIETVKASSFHSIQQLLGANNTKSTRSIWHLNDWGSVNFRESPILDWELDLPDELGLRKRMLWTFETGTVVSAMVLGSIIEHNDKRTLWYTWLCTLFLPLSLPDDIAEFWTWKSSSGEYRKGVRVWDGICFDQNYNHHFIFDARNTLGTWVTIFVTRASFEKALKNW